ncbi:nitrate reductase [Marinibactrum halimedae]|uniref:Nitrate reductase n=1 Tax=Marinibactrum halimedae TaxID=1444977 RepID=A0AA37T363_9GAMM|nr:nitrate reductase [Marinibactrum halimedae]MCD9458713.1 molybdopterin-dependent oxidoreductase [Marinibactrum halimedae]GLS25920.1 nitrate reductase [Marinibactrum halimedae]
MTTKRENWIKTTCAYCGVGCGVEAQVQSYDELGNARVKVRGDKTHPANYGRLCSKGLALGDTLVGEGRLLHPSIHGMRASWDHSLDYVAKGFRKIIDQHGPDSVAFYVSGQLLTEDYYVANKLMKGFIGSGNIDTNSRLCMSSSVAGHKRAFGTDTVPNVYADFEQANLVVMVGSNLAWCHPVLYQRLVAAKSQRPSMKIVVIDPRKTDTCSLADLHLPIKSGTDVALFNGLLAAVVASEAFDKEYVDRHVEGVEKAVAAAKVDAPSIEETAELVGVSCDDLACFYDWVIETPKTLTLYSQGVNQSSAGVDKVNAILNTHLVTGRIGKPGSGPFSVTGQPNAMGGREVGGLANTLASHLEFDDEEARERVSQFWKAERLATAPGLPAVSLFDAIAEGKVKAVWVMATNPAVSLPNADAVKVALESCELVVVSDCVSKNDTLNFAHVALPATGWGEKSGVVTNSERRMSRQRALVPAAGEAKPDWWIISEVAKRMGYAEAFDYQSAAEIFQEYAAMTGLAAQMGRDLDISPLKLMDEEDYNAMPPQQWPLKSPDSHTQHKRFFSEGGFFTPDARGRCIAVSYQEPKTATSNEFPLILNTGRLRDQWHTMTRTGLPPKLNAHRPEPELHVHPLDAKAESIVEGSIAEVSSSVGRLRVRVRFTLDQRRGEVYMPIHWSDANSSDGRVSQLVTPEVDPISAQPESKFTPVAISPWHYKSCALVAVRDPIDAMAYGYWVQQRIENGYLYYIADEVCPDQLQKQIERCLPRNDANQKTLTRLDFEDPKRGVVRQARFEHQPQKRLLDACVVGPSLDSQQYEWFVQILAAPVSVDVQKTLLSGVASGSLAEGRIVCACKQVGIQRIIDGMVQCGSVHALSALTGAGTGCGSCLPELQQLWAEHQDSA